MKVSRSFVCVRPQTYEDAAESEFLRSVFRGGGTLKNTTFALLDSKGETLSRGSRSPQMTYGSVENFVEALQKTAKRYAQKSKSIQALPTIRTLRLALNVAAADMRPLIVVRGKNAKDAAKLAKRMAKLSWRKELVGAGHYVVLHEKTTFEKLVPPLGISLIQPDPYGLGGKVLKKYASSTSDITIRKGLVKAIKAYEVTARGHRDHIREARRRGIEWKAATPVTDKGGRGAR